MEILGSSVLKKKRQEECFLNSEIFKCGFWESLGNTVGQIEWLTTVCFQAITTFYLKCNIL